MLTFIISTLCFQFDNHDYVVTGLHYAVPYPHREFNSGRNLRMSPIYPKLKEAGAIFGQVMGYERPNWFDCDNILGTVLNVLVIRTSRF